MPAVLAFLLALLWKPGGPPAALGQEKAQPAPVETNPPTPLPHKKPEMKQTRESEKKEDEIVVRGTAAPPAFVRRLDESALRKRGADHAGQILEGESGVETVESPKQGVQLQLGGFDVKAAAVFLEGIPFLEPYSGLTDISQLPAGLFCSITLRRGIVPVTLGPDTLGGRVDLDILGCPQTGISVFVRAGGGRGLSIPSWRTGAAGRTRRGAWTFFGAAEAAISDGYPLSARQRETVENAAFPDNGGLRDASASRQISATAGFSWAPRNTLSLTALALFLRAPREIPPHMQSGYMRHWTLTLNDSLLLGARVSRSFPQGFLRRAWGMVFAHLHRDRLDDWEDLSHSTPTTNPSAFFVSSEYENALFGADAGMRLAFREGQSLEIALLWRLMRHFSQEKPVTDQGFDAPWGKYDEMWAHRITLAAENRSQAGAWTLFEGVSGGMLQLTARRLREEAYDVDETPMPGVEGSAGFRRGIGRNLSIETAAGYKIRYPSLKELFSNRVGGNPELDPEKAVLAYGALQARRDQRARFELRLSAARVSGLIDRWGETYQNLDDALIAGAEAEAAAAWRRLSFYARYRWQTARILDSGKPLPGRARHRGAAGISGRWGKFSASVDATARSFVTLQYYDVADGLFHEGVSGARILFNARLRQEFEITGGSVAYVQLSARNLFDAPGEEGTFEPRAGREFWLEVGLQY